MASVKGRGAKQRKARREAQIEQCEAILQGIGLTPARRFVDRKHEVADRQALSRARLRTTQDALHARATMSPAKVLATFRKDFRALRSQSKSPAQAKDVVSEGRVAPSDLTQADIDIVHMQRLGHAVHGKLLGLQLGWPKDWMNRPDRRIYVLFDLRPTAARCVAIFIQDGRRRPVGQLFWLCEVKTGFGKRELRFFDSTTGARSRTLALRDDRFIVYTGNDQRPDGFRDRMQTLERKVKRTMREPVPVRDPFWTEFELESQREEDERARHAATALPPRAGAESQKRVVETYRRLVDSIKTGTPVPTSQQSRNHTQPRSRAQQGRADVLTMAEAGYFRLGELTGAQFEWPQKWIGKSNRSVYFLVDLRDIDRLCVVFVMQDQRRKPKAQMFWLHRSTDQSPRTLLFRERRVRAAED